MNPNPLDTAASPELVEAYRDLRRFRVHMMFGLVHVGFALTSLAVAVAVACGVSGESIGIMGAIIGTLLGVAGGIFGTVAGVRRARITELLTRLSADPAKRTT
ncbi:MAG: hypothetical protein R3C10_19785 [Pirellulales bacterium]